MDRFSFEGTAELDAFVQRQLEMVHFVLNSFKRVIVNIKELRKLPPE